jgi:uncharacterized membrane protein HdeD (DUF308 family)
MNIMKSIFGALLILFGVLILIYLIKNKSYSQGERFIDAPIQLTSSAIISILLGVLLITNTL